ncbi:DUF1272 domain-containing protein [Rhodococcus erythropolis]|uniref:DUF1272 domain-containing protein n=1 Tax=Rhodococcus erythropolis TaxID=1833 RepID=A0A8I0ZYL0_RHOER|nr:DUF1272 domain-containing protein [Rhodococcus erythropolis]MBH5141989.1 DUF1272 domain-containing protein [Rhodococcus erythropolis]MBH5145357.1 DUF1272 domain-containing protein [Rhodococcus erythropolis]MBH5145403.1 DUF1272 domain-containing protein [Rhodococcus erythropolis]
MLAMKTICERCRTSLDNAAAATICSYECTFCVDCSAAMDNECPNCGGELTARPRRTAQARAIRRGWAGRIGSYLAQHKTSGVLELTDAERNLISQIKATDGERLAAIEVRHMRPDCTPREALITVLTLRGEDVFRTPTDHVLDENAARADGKPQTL